MTNFAVFDDSAIWGVGNTEQEAWDDVRQWINGEDFDRAKETMECARMTKALAVAVRERGGNIPFGEWKGRLLTYRAFERLYVGS